MADDLSALGLEAALAGRPGELRYFDSIASTNTEALAWATQGAPEWSVVAADHQTSGRGRWGRSWFSAPGKLLQFSLILRPDLAPAAHGVLTAGLGVATARALRAESGLPVKIKWPNDAVIEGRKLGGMLVESQMTSTRLDAAICGIGINVHLVAADIPADLADRATSVALEVERAGAGRVPSRSALLARIVSEVTALYPSITGEARPLLDEAASLSDVLGREVTIRYADGGSLQGRAEGFDADGALRVTTGDGTVSVHVGEIEQLR